MISPWNSLFAFLSAALLLIKLSGPAAAVPPPLKPSHARIICEIIVREAQARGLPVSYFTRLIWKESRFDAKAVSPKGAQGIAQFMPETAKLRGLADPFRPREALEASAHLLSELNQLFGNLGLDAAAYNAGKERVRDWLDGRRVLPAETLDYVLSITGRPASDWSRNDARHPIPPIGQGNVITDCVKFASLRDYRALRPAQARGDWKPWGVQLTGAPSDTVALAMFQRIQARHADLLGGLTPLVVRKRNPGMGLRRIANMRIGAASRAEAERFCAKLLAREIACIVRRN